MTIYSEELAGKVLDLLAGGSRLYLIEKMEGMPDRTTVWYWRKNNPDFARAYEQAMLHRLETRTDEFAEKIASTPEDMAALKKLEIYLKTEMWEMEKLNPKKYGDRTVIAGDKDNPLTLTLASTLDQRIAERASRKALEQKESLPIIDGESVEIDENVN